MKGSKILLGVGAASIALLLMAPASFAQCAVPQEFGAQGNGMLTGRIRIDTTTNGYPNNGNEVMSVWDTVNGSGLLGMGAHFAALDTCTNWYITGSTPGIPAATATFLGANAGIQALFGSPTCGLAQCPLANARVSTLVEDQTQTGSNAGFVVYSVDSTFSAIRPWDHARTAGIGGAGGANQTAVQIFQNYPTVDVTGSSGPPPSTTLTNNYVDLALNFHGADMTAAGSSALVSYDIVGHRGTSDPGRNRSAYTLGTVASVTYANAGVNGHMLAVPCGSVTDDVYLAVGASFRNGAGSFQSLRVGKSVAVECDPNIANPQQPMIERAPQRSRKIAPIGR